MNGKKSKDSISIRNIIIIVFMTIMLATVIVIGTIVFSNWLSSADKSTAKMAEDLSGKIFQQVDAFIHVPTHINEVNLEIIKNGIVDLANETEREKFFVGVLKTQNTDIYSFSIGTEKGEYYGARRNKSGVIEIMRNNASTGGQSWYYSVTDELTAGNRVVQAGKFDPRTRDWYKVAKETHQPVFSPIYKHFVMNDLTVSAAYPIYNKDGQLQGVLGTHIILSNINNYLKEIVKDKNGFAVIAEKDTGKLIANSLGIENFTTLEDSTFKRFTLSDSGNESIAKAYEHYITTKDTNFKIASDSKGMYINLSEYHKNGLDWIVITAIPKSLLIAGIVDNMKLTFLLVILAIMFSMVIYFIVTNKLLKPIDSLIEVADKLSKGDLFQRVTIIRNDEIGRISKAFNKMADMLFKLVNNLEVTVKERTAELEAAYHALKESKDQLRLILDSTAEAIYGFDTDGNCTFCNASCIAVLGYKYPGELLGKNMHVQIHHSYKDGSPMPVDECKIFKSFMEGQFSHVDDEVFWRADGTSFDVEYHSYPQFKNGKIIGAVVTFMDITQRKRNDEQIEYLSCHDFLTGLYNRRYFENALKNIDSNRNLPLSIIFGDINGLKMTNDIFGHAAGDALIKKSAEILKGGCTEEDIVARVGGDEFIILLPNTDAIGANKIMAKIKYELSQVQIAAIKCTMSVGCDTKSTIMQKIERTMENAENEMYKEKTLTRKSTNYHMIQTIIATLHDKSPQEKRHSLAVSELCQNIGQAMQLPETEVKKLKEAGFLHDIGKIVLDENILNKEGMLTEEEKKEMQQHSVVGYRILNLFDDKLNLAEGVYSHHEKWNGSGYPKGLKGEEIPKLSRIIAVAEAYDAMTNNYNKVALNKEAAIQKMKKLSGVYLDPEIVDVFVQLISGLPDQK